MSQRDDNWERLQKIQIVRKTPMEKKLDNMTKVIQNPDEFNVNIASRERIDELERRLGVLEKKIKKLVINTRKRK